MFFSLKDNPKKKKITSICILLKAISSWKLYFDDFIMSNHGKKSGKKRKSRKTIFEIVSQKVQLLFPNCILLSWHLSFQFKWSLLSLNSHSDFFSDMNLIYFLSLSYMAKSIWGRGIHTESSQFISSSVLYIVASHCW